MPEGFRLEWVIGILLVFGICFWISLFFSTQASRSLKVGWGWLDWRPLPHDLPQMMLVTFFVGFVLQLCLGALLSYGSVAETLPPGLLILVSILLFQGLMAFVFFQHLQRRGLEPLDVLGMENPLRLLDVVWGLAAYCMCLPLVGLSAGITQYLFTQFQWEMKVQPMIEQLSQLTGWLNWVSLFLLVGFIGPLLEEVVFRGFVFTWLRQRLGTVSGIVIQALIFAVIHQHVASLLPLFALAVLLGWAYVYTRRLMVCVWAHAIFNTMTLIQTVLMSKMEAGL
ncbi:CPBP family intramembrane metalloprotease [Kiritimatiellota bacterium B12222]|nr:CPBP family intramembrane metalloprotease [Kiritimatiellota bacterium B12222]